jgi:prolipoprotein diacylglyceryltransferase
VLLLVDRWVRIRPPGLFCLYVAWYTFARFFMELLRVDEAHEWFGLRLNAWVSIAVFVLALVGFVWSQRRKERGPRRREPAPPPPPEGPKMAVPKGRIR